MIDLVDVDKQKNKDLSPCCFQKVHFQTVLKCLDVVHPRSSQDPDEEGVRENKTKFKNKRRK